MNRLVKLAPFALLVTVAMATTANAGILNFSASTGGAPTGVAHANFDNLALGSAVGSSGGITVSFDPDAKAVQGTTAGQFAVPYLTGGNGDGFGNPGDQALGSDITTYLTSGVSRSGVTLTMPATMRYFGILWGSVDTYNTLNFYIGDSLAGSLTGSQVKFNANGDQGPDGTVYVNVNFDQFGYDRVEAVSTQYAFEFDNVAYNPDPIPEPASMLLLGTGLIGVGRAWRKRRA